MEWLQTLLDSSTTPVLTAFLLGLLTAISPCLLATNIAAIGYIGKDIEDRRRVFLNGLLYTAGRIVAYTVLGLVLILIIRQGASMFGIQKFIGTWGELLLGPALIVIFCPTSGMFYFGMLIPMSATATLGYLLPAVFAFATALPVLVVAWLLAFSMQKVGKFYGRIKGIERLTTVIVGVLFVLIGLYECYIIYL